MIPRPKPTMSIEQYAVLCMKWMGLQHEAAYCAKTQEESLRVKQELAEVEGQLRAAPWKVVQGEIVPA